MPRLAFGSRALNRPSLRSIPVDPVQVGLTDMSADLFSKSGVDLPGVSNLGHDDLASARVPELDSLAAEVRAHDVALQTIEINKLLIS